jgi:hypothetical protein
MTKTIEATQVPRYCISPSVRFSTDHDGTAILSVRDGAFYSLIGTASSVWSSIASHEDGLTAGSIADQLLTNDYEFMTESPDAVGQVVSQFLTSLTDTGLISVTGSLDSKGTTGIRLHCCIALARITRHIARELLKWRRPVFASLLAFIAFYIIASVGQFPARYHVVKHWPFTPADRGPGIGTPEVCAAVNSAAAWFPKQSLCLQRASVLTCMLRLRGTAAQMNIGIRKLPFGSHAWVEVDGEVVGDSKKVQTFFQVIDRC